MRMREGQRVRRNKNLAAGTETKLCFIQDGMFNKIIIQLPMCYTFNNVSGHLPPGQPPPDNYP